MPLLNLPLKLQTTSRPSFPCVRRARSEKEARGRNDRAKTKGNEELLLVYARDGSNHQRRISYQVVFYRKPIALMRLHDAFACIALHTDSIVGSTPNLEAQILNLKFH